MFKKNIKIKGSLDRPIYFNVNKNIEHTNENILFPEEYLEAFTNFMENCDTPITISLQGAWGTGKTSFYNAIRNGRLKSTYLFKEFDVWNFSKFGMGENLPLILIKYLCKFISPYDNYTLDCVKKILNIGFRTFTAKNFDKPYNFDEVFDVDTITKIEELKEKFNDSVQELLNSKDENKEYKKLVLFIDNLDRLKPSEAIEIIEILHTYFSCDNCIFILAVDYDVVVKGAKDKYKDDKGNEYFDKMIQLPFDMPTEYYKMEEYFCEKFERAFKESLLNNEEMEILKKNCYELTKLFVGNNPRSVNRLINAFTIIYAVDRYNVSEENYVLSVTELLFCLLCIKFKDRNLYKYLLRNRECIRNGNEKVNEYIDKCKDAVRDKEMQDKYKYHKEDLKNMLDKFTELVLKASKELDTKNSKLFDVLNQIGSIDDENN